MKEYKIFRCWENGNVDLCATFSTAEKAKAVVKEWQEKTPSAMYQIFESERI